MEKPRRKITFEEWAAENPEMIGMAHDRFFTLDMKGYEITGKDLKKIIDAIGGGLFVDVSDTTLINSDDEENP